MAVKERTLEMFDTITREKILYVGDKTDISYILPLTLRLERRTLLVAEDADSACTVAAADSRLACNQFERAVRALRRAGLLGPPAAQSN